MYPITRAAIGNRNGYRLSGEPALAFIQDDAFTVQAEVDVGIRGDRDVESNCLGFGGKVVIGVRLDDRTGSQLHQAHGKQRTLKSGQHLLEVRAACQKRAA